MVVMVCKVGSFACYGGGQHRASGGAVVKLHHADGGAACEASRAVCVGCTVQLRVSGVGCGDVVCSGEAYSGSVGYGSDDVVVM